MIKKSLGGDRIGSGNKMNVALHNYERSTHNLSAAWRSTMAPGTLVPFLKQVALNGDTWSIDLRNALVRTMPAIGPLFGSYKLQLDVFECPIRLYNGILHNNMTKIGLDMAKVKLPKIELKTTGFSKFALSKDEFSKQLSDSSLMTYLGMRGIAGIKKPMTAEAANAEVKRKVQCIPILAYYDIFKNYYSNKQEENAYVIANTLNAKMELPKGANVKGRFINLQGNWEEFEQYNTMVYDDQAEDYSLDNTLNLYQQKGDGTIIINSMIRYDEILIKIPSGYMKAVYGDATYTAGPTAIIEVLDSQGGPNNQIKIPIQAPTAGFKNELGEEFIKIAIPAGFRAGEEPISIDNPDQDETYTIAITGFEILVLPKINSEIKLQQFPLDNIDNMRIWLLRNTTLGTELTINDFNYYPYKSLWDNSEAEDYARIITPLRGEMVGLCVKTYQSDMFNNWLSSEWIDGINGINDVTAVSTAGDSFTIDALNLAHKVYNMLNRIAVSGGTYEDWQEAVYGEDAIRRAESPIYCGGASGIITFEEIVSTADTDTAAAGDQPLGSLAGKGVLVNQKGGIVEIHVKEPSYIIGIASITPLIDYNQGNDWDITELDSINDLHKPALDCIGFQDLMLEQAAWWATYVDPDDQDEDKGKLYKTAGGKLPAWLNYMTNYNRVYGEFSDRNKLGYMVLTREYEEDTVFYGGSVVEHDGHGSERIVPIADWTTYINPTKFNYQFADTSLTAQNFWVQIGEGQIARRKMSAKLIPNL